MTVHSATFSQLVVIVRLTLREARRRRLLWLGLGMGLAFVALFATGYYFAYEDFRSHADYVGMPQVEYLIFGSTFLTAALYVVNFLVVMITVLTAVGTISSEIDTNTIHTIAAKPVHRWQIVLGKWIGHTILVVLYTTVLASGVMLAVYLISGFSPSHPIGVVLILILEGLAVLSLTMLGGTLFSTLANGVVVFMIYGLAFVGGWVEQIGSMLESQTAVDLGIASSLLLPSEGLWRYAAGLMQSGLRFSLPVTPFSIASQPTPAFVVYAGLYTLALLGAAIGVFSQKDF